MKPNFKRTRNVQNSTQDSNINCSQGNRRWASNRDIIPKTHSRNNFKRILNRSLTYVRNLNAKRLSNNKYSVHNDEISEKSEPKPSTSNSKNLPTKSKSYQENGINNKVNVYYRSPQNSNKNKIRRRRRGAKRYFNFNERDGDNNKKKLIADQLVPKKQNNKKDSKLFTLKKANNSHRIDSDEDDCVCIEPSIDLICIDDDDTKFETHNKNLELIKTNKIQTSTPIAQNKIKKLQCETIILDDSMPPGKEPPKEPCTVLESATLTNTLTDQLHKTDLNDDNMTNESETVGEENELISKNTQIINNDNNYENLRVQSYDALPDQNEFDAVSLDDDIIEIMDDSICKIETPDFIPLSKDSPCDKKRTQKTSKKSKKNNEYNKNCYNPNEKKPGKANKKRIVIIDGNNVAYSHACSREFSVKGLQICIDYFLHLGHEVKAVIPQMRLKKSKSSNPKVLERLHAENKIVFTPCKNLPGKTTTSYDDRIILQLADELDGVIISNDNFKDLVNENQSFKRLIESRVIGYTWCNDVFILPKDPYGRWGPPLSAIMERQS